MCGTPVYFAPEIISIKPYGKSVDWWALGIVLFEMVSGHTPFNASNKRKLFNKILNGSYRIPKHFSPELSNLVRNLLQSDLTQRLGIMQNGVDDIKKHR